MRNLKKFLALVLAMMMMLSVAVISTSAADADADYTDAASFLAALNIMKGNENGDLMLDQGVTRYQAALFFVQALTGETDVAYWNAEKKSANFADVPEYGTAIDHAYGINIIKGRGNGVYGYNDPIMYQDMLVMAVRALGYETADMSYPYGFILAAQKLGITENVEQKNYKAALNRGETAQIIADMLETEIAAVDPLNDKILYPGEEKTSLTATLSKNENAIPRTTLLEDVGFAGGKITATIVDFVEADEDDEESVDTVKLNVTIDEKELADDTVVVAAADLGITVDTRKVEYMGLPVELYINLADKATFSTDDYDAEDATIVLASYPEYTTVTNLSDAGDIKYVVNTDDATKSYLSIGGTKFVDEKYSGEVFTFNQTKGTWEKLKGADARALLANFLYEDDEYVATSGNTYVSVAYRETDRTYDPTPADTENKDEKTIVEILYTPLSFGQYNVREIKDNKYTVIGKYETTAAENMDEVDSNFVEYLVDGGKKITSSTKTVSNNEGEAALNVVVEGEAVEAGDFMFYAYNEVDNVLTVAMNCGTFETGRLSGKSTQTNNEGVKINGTLYNFGFKGVFSVKNMKSTWDDYKDVIDSAYIKKLEAGMDNVKYIVVDGNIVYMEPCTVTANESKFDFAIINQTDKLAELLDLSTTVAEGATTSEFEDALTGGLYVEDGEVKVAMLNKTTGEWELATVGTYAKNWKVEEGETEGKFANEYNLADVAKYTDLLGTSYKDNAIADEFAAVKGVVAVVEVEDGVYTLAKNETLTESEGAIVDYGFFVAGDADTNGISFSKTNNNTNAITADNELDKARVTVDDETVIIVVDASGNAGVRVGVQKDTNSFKVEKGYFLAASADLIVLVETAAADGTNVATWGKAASANADETYYVTTFNSGVDVNAGDTKDDPYIVTISNVIDLKTNTLLESVSAEFDPTDDAAKIDALLAVSGAGTKLFKEATGDITITDKKYSEIATALALVDNDEYKELTAADINGMTFTDATTIAIPGTVLDGVDAYDIVATVVTIDNTGLDTEKYDFTGVISNKAWTEADETKYGVGDTTVKYTGKTNDEYTVCEYALDTELVKEITEPTAGVLDQFIIDTDASGSFRILVPEVDNDDYADAETITISMGGTYLVEDGVVTLVIYKVLSK